METLIVICLLIVIVLLAKDKIIVTKEVSKKKKGSRKNSHVPDIMGKSKSTKSLLLLNTTNECQNNDLIIETNNFDIEIEQEDFDIEIPEEELDENFGNVPDFEEEEEEWNGYRDTGGDDNFGFATGVTFEELSAVGMLLQQETLEPSQQNKVVKIVLKTQGTELFTLLENSMENASQKIAELLHKSFSTEKYSSSTIMLINDFETFDIGEFL
nr:conjugal transfer protein TraD [uncultured Flavobacterium sp.]